MPILVCLDLIKLRKLKVLDLLELFVLLHIRQFGLRFLSLKDSNDLFLLRYAILASPLAPHLMVFENYVLFEVFVEIGWNREVLHSWDFMEAVRVSVISNVIYLDGLFKELKQDLI